MRLPDGRTDTGVYALSSATLGAVTAALDLPTSSGCKKNCEERSDRTVEAGSNRVSDLTPAKAIFLAVQKFLTTPHSRYHHQLTYLFPHLDLSDQR